MAPKRGAASQRSSSPTKKAKVSHNADVEHVQSVLRNKTTDLPEAARSMLIAMVPGSLGIPSDERHEHQSAAIEMIEETLGAVKSRMVESIAAEDANVAEADSQKASLEATVEDALARVEARKNAVEAKKKELTDATAKAKEAQKECSKAVAAQKSGDAAINDLKAKRADLEALISGSLKAVKEGTWSTEKEVKKIVSELNRSAKSAAVDASLLTALPAACNKKPEDQGTFDKMVIANLEESFTAQMAALDTEIGNGAPASQERAAVVAAADAALEAAKATQQACTNEVTQAQTDEQEAESHAEATRKARKEYGPAYRAATKVRNNLTALLAEFEEDLEVVDRLKKQISKRKQRELDAEAKAAAAEAKAADAATDEQGIDAQVAE